MLLPLHLDANTVIHLEGLLLLLVPTTVVVGLGLEKLRMRRQGNRPAAPESLPTWSESSAVHTPSTGHAAKYRGGGSSRGGGRRAR